MTDFWAASHLWSPDLKKVEIFCIEMAFWCLLHIMAELHWRTRDKKYLATFWIHAESLIWILDQSTLCPNWYIQISLLAREFIKIFTAWGSHYVFRVCLEPHSMYDAKPLHCICANYFFQGLLRLFLLLRGPISTGQLKRHANTLSCPFHGKGIPTGSLVRTTANM